MLKDLYYKIRWEGFTLGGNGGPFGLRYSPMCKGMKRFHFSYENIGHSKHLWLHLGLFQLSLWRYHAELDTDEPLTVGERGCW